MCPQGTTRNSTGTNKYINNADATHISYVHVRLVANNEKHKLPTHVRPGVYRGLQHQASGIDAVVAQISFPPEYDTSIAERLAVGSPYYGNV